MNGSGAPAGPVALVTHARHVPVDEREAFAVVLRDRPPAGGLVLATCHRVEAHLAGPDAVELAAELPAGGRLLTGDAAIRHAITVAVGLDSVVVGEDQLLHQVREAVAAARRAGESGLDPVVERLFATALRTGRRARSWRRGTTGSLADVALAAISRGAGELRGRPILVVGGGRMGRLAAAAATAAGAVVTVASRTPEHAAGLAADLRGFAAPFDPGTAAGASVGIVVALRGPWPIGPATAAAIMAGTAVVVDLSVPPAVPAALASALGGRHVSADDLAHHPAAPAANPDAERLAALVDAATTEFTAWLEAHDRRAAAEALAQRAETERLDELADLWRRLPLLDPEARDVIDGMSRHLAARLLREPLERLGRDPDGRHERAVRELFGL